ncbi:MAG: GGDEF domain-containing protein, partial [Pseudomonadota bacterium]|nr:GGDEF domain-containing protein [Pseudomonadota bacterium]
LLVTHSNYSCFLAITEYHQQAVDLSSPFNQEWCTYYLNSGAVIDIDYFKHVNDTFGHTTGDRVIKIVADVIRERLRDSDVSCRWGGEEFAVYLHNTTGVDAITLAEELRILVQGRKIVEQGKTIRVTVSLGITTITHNDTPTSLFSRADSALYKAKQQGRNQVYVEFA